MPAVPLPAKSSRQLRCWFLALTLATSSSLAASADPPLPADPPAPAPALQADAPLRYRVVIKAPAEIEKPLTSAVDLVRWQDYADMTEDLFDRLARNAVSEATEAAGTQGYFSPSVDIAVDRSTQPVTVTLTVTPGEPTRIDRVDIEVTGPASNAPAAAPVLADIRETWLLPKGAIFRQQAWTAAKQRAVATLAGSAYAATKLTSSEARIDPPAHTADLHVALDSGPPFHFGAIEIHGVEKYSPDIVRNFSTITRGELYSEQTLDDYVRRLLASGYFASVQASIDTDPTVANDAPVTLNIIEAPAKRLELGAGYSTDTQYRVSATYSDMNINGRALQFLADARVESKLQQFNIRFQQPPSSTGWIDTYTTGLQRTDIENLVTRTASVAARRRAINERRTPAFGAGYYSNEQTPDGMPTESSHALYVDGEYTWRNVDDLLEPTRGWMANVQMGVGVPGVSSETFGRLIGKFITWYPVTRANQFTVRADLGAVIAQSRVGIPSNFLFRTGGDTTVRGYAFESLGVAVGDSIVGGRYFGVGSVEFVHWVTEVWGVAAFVDAGNATDSLSDVDLAVGYGVGARLRTPIGPFRVDVAYGEQQKSVRVHFSVGLSF
jgi:translocation and assembly module TamA